MLRFLKNLILTQRNYYWHKAMKLESIVLEKVFICKRCKWCKRLCCIHIDRIYIAIWVQIWAVECHYSRMFKHLRNVVINALNSPAFYLSSWYETAHIMRWQILGIIYIIRNGITDFWPNTDAIIFIRSLYIVRQGIFVIKNVHKKYLKES